MLHRFIETIRHIKAPSGFEAYLLNLQKHGVAGVPSVEEARRDYRDTIRRETGLIA